VSADNLAAVSSGILHCVDIWIKVAIMSDEASKNFEFHHRNVTDQPNSEEPISEALLEEELLAAERDIVNDLKSKLSDTTQTPAATVPPTDLDASQDQVNLMSEAVAGDTASTPTENTGGNITLSTEVEPHEQENH